MGHQLAAYFAMKKRPIGDFARTISPGATPVADAGISSPTVLTAAPSRTGRRHEQHALSLARDFAMASASALDADDLDVRRDALHVYADTGDKATGKDGLKLLEVGLGRISSDGALASNDAEVVEGGILMRPPWVALLAHSSRKHRRNRHRGARRDRPALDTFLWAC